MSLTMLLAAALGMMTASVERTEEASIERPTQCRIAWQMKRTGFIGHGDWHSVDQHEMLVSQMDAAGRRNPEMVHWLECQ